MKNIIKNSVILVLYLSVIPLLNSCKKHEVPTLTTSEVTNITGTTAISGGTITDEGSGTIVERGICWSEELKPTVVDSRTIEGGGDGTFASDMTNLDGGTTYYVRAYATNEAGTGYGMALSFKTLGDKPIAITHSPTNVSSSGVTLNGAVNPNYLSTVITFEYGTTTSYGQTITSTQSPVEGNNLLNVNADISGLAPGTTYHYRIVTVNSVGTSNGNDITFTTMIAVPTLTTVSISDITTSSAVTGGIITSDGGDSITERGVCWSVTSNPTLSNDRTMDGYGAGSFASNMKCLSFATTYYVRAYATNSVGTAYGDQKSITTQGTNPIIFNPDLTYGSVSDIDGNCYKTIQIGTQTWMAENLKTTKYNDNTSIPNVTDNNEWANMPLAEWVGNPGDPLPMIYVTFGAYCWYDNKTDSYGNDYGILYNWGSVGTDKLCPTGWHVPSLTEWRIICPRYDYENGPFGEELMEIGKTHWNESAKIDGTNTTGFTALPGGYRLSTSEFKYSGYQGFYWTADGRQYPGFKFAWNIYYSGFIQSPSKVLESEREGRSVRCLKDN